MADEEGFESTKTPLEEVLENTKSLIRNHGWAVMRILDRLPYAYTVGLSPALPEFIVFGIHSGAEPFLNYIADVSLKIPLQHGTTLNNVFGGPIKFIEATDTSDLIIAHQLFSQVQALQVVWADDNGKFPWEEGFDLGINADIEIPLLGPTPQ